MGSTRAVRADAAIAACWAVVLGLSGCTSDGKASGQAVDRVSTKPSASASPSASSALAGLSGRQIADRSFAAMKSLHSVTVKADLAEDDGRIRADVTIGGKGACAMHATVPGMGTFTYVRTPKATVVKLGRKAIRAIAGPEAAKLFVGKYVKVGDDPTFEDMRSMCKARYFTGELADESDGVTFTRTGTATVAGVRAVVLTATSEGGRSRLYVAATGRPYLLKATGHDKEYSGTVTIGDFDRAPAIHLPPASKTIDIGKLHG